MNYFMISNLVYDWLRIQLEYKAGYPVQYAYFWETGTNNIIEYYMQS